MNLTLEDIKKLVGGLAEKIGAPHQLLPTYGYSIDGAHPHIEVDRYGLYYVVVERGRELKRDFAADTDDLLYRIFAGVTFSMAVDFEVKHRIETEDFRRQMFQKQEDLLGILNEKWRDRQNKEHQRILRSHPFDDQSNVRVEFAVSLRSEGVSPEEAWAEACKKYPLPKSA